GASGDGAPLSVARSISDTTSADALSDASSWRVPPRRDRDLPLRRLDRLAAAPAASTGTCQACQACEKALTERSSSATLPATAMSATSEVRTGDSSATTSSTSAELQLP